MPLDACPQSYCATPDGVLLIADGVNAVRRWDGIAAATDTAGVIPPSGAPTIASCGKGPITGTLYAYERFVDGRGNLSNLSTISSAFMPYVCGTVSAATNSSPIALGSVAHGLSTGDVVNVTGVQGCTAANGTAWSIVVRDENNFSLNGSVGNGAYTAGGCWVAGKAAPPGRGAILSASNATPVVIGSYAHGLATGAKVTITGVAGNLACNGSWVATVIDGNNFSIADSLGNPVVGTGAYTTGGFWVSTRVTPTAGTVLAATNASPIAIGSVAHGLSSGDSVTVLGVGSNLAANGSWTITVVDSNNFSLNGSVGNGQFSSGGTWYGGSGPPLFAGPITGATNASPIVITSVAHGLSDEDAVTITGVGGNGAANGTWSVLRVSADTFSLTDSTGNGSYTANTGTFTAGARAITYSSVPTSAESKVTRRQLLRNSSGQAQTFYVDIDSTSLAATSFTSTQDDITVATGTAVPLLNTDGSLAANVHDVPPNHKLALAHHLGRMYYAAEATVAQGSVQVTNGSTTVTGIGTSWTSKMSGRVLSVVGATQLYTISSVDTSAQTLAISSSYADTTNKFALYAIRPAMAERRVIYYSEATLPESVPVLNQITLDETNDEITGLMTTGSYLYFLERAHIWRYAVQSDPAADGYPWLVSSRGCINHRCYAVVHDQAYMLDQAGIHAFSGQDSEPISQPIQDIFRADNIDYGINWQASALFHCLHEPDAETVSWFVAMAGEYLPRHAIVYHYRTKRWWVEEYARPIGASAKGRYRGHWQAYFGTDAFKVLARAGTMDGPDATTGTVRGTVTSSSPLSITDAYATFPTSGVVGGPVDIVAGRGKGQRRLATQVSGTTISINQPWLILPDTTSTYQLGGVRWSYGSPDYKWLKTDGDVQRRVELHFTPVGNQAVANLQLYFDEDAAPQTWTGTYSADDHQGISVTTGDSNLVVDLTHATGTVQQRMDYQRELYTEGPRYVSFVLSGVANSERILISEYTLDGVTR